MLSALKFVQGAISKKDLIPAQTHFLIDNGKIRSFNGNIALCSPIPIDINCQPKAAPLIKMISECKEIPQLKMTEAGRLSVKSGKLRVLIDCFSEIMPYIVPSGTLYEVDGDLVLKALKKLQPVVTTNTKHAWANGVLFSNGSAFATNNVILVQYWTNSVFAKPVNIPLACVDEVVRINEKPLRVQISDISITFHYENGRWLYSNLIADKWPDVMRILEADSVPIEMPTDIFTAIKSLKSFAKEDRVFFNTGAITTGDSGATYEMGESFDFSGAYGASMFLLLQDMAKTIDLTRYPQPALFFGENIRGAISGMKE